MEPKEIRVNGLRVRYLVAGEGERLALLLHGFPDDAGSMRGLMAGLAADGWRCVAPYLRGYDGSEMPASGEATVAALAADALGLIDALGHRQAAIVGHDWGSAIAHVAAMTAPQSVTHLVGMAVPPPQVFAYHLRRNPRQMRRSWYMAFFQLRGIAEWSVRRNNFAFIDRLWRAWSPGWIYPRERIDEVKVSLATPGSLKAALAYYRQNLKLDGGEGASKIEAPGLLIAGANDGCIGPECFEGAERAFVAPPRLEVVKDAGHFMHLEQPDKVLGLVREFLA